MSKFSGRCDLYDYICMEKMYDRGTYKVSDEMECFEIFKKNTKGVLYQTVPFKLTSSNIDKEIKRINNPKILSKIEHKVAKIDKRCKSGSRDKTYYTYIYWNKEFRSISVINKLVYTIQKEIKFETILDLVPYYPYIVTVATAFDGKEHVCISTTSAVDREEQEAFSYGYCSSMPSVYRKALQNHYIELVERYFNSNGREQEEVLSVFRDDDDLYIKTSKSIDYNFNIDVNIDNTSRHNDTFDPRWKYSSPVCTDYDSGLICITNVWPESVSEGDTIRVNYVEKIEHQRYLEG